MTPAASLAVGPLEAAVIATIRNASFSGAAVRHLSTRQRNADAVEKKASPWLRGGRSVVFTSNGAAGDKHLLLTSDRPDATTSTNFHWVK